MSKPKCELIGQNGNIFNLMGIATGVLKDSGKPIQAKELCDRVFSCDSYEKALAIISEYVEVV